MHLQLTTDERHLVATDTRDPERVFTIDWPAWLYQVENEPTGEMYDQLAGEMTGALVALLEDEGWTTDPDWGGTEHVAAAVLAAVTPGAPRTERQLRFAVVPARPANAEADVVKFQSNEERVQFCLRKAATGACNYFVGFKDADPEAPYGLSYAWCPWVVPGGIYSKDLGGLIH